MADIVLRILRKRLVGDDYSSYLFQALLYITGIA